MVLIEDFRDQAAACRRFAETEADETDRSVWLLLQNAWMQLSDEVPKMLEASPGSKASAPPPRGKAKRRR
jgi:hypothetical protein